ncbi:MAG: hypothetical protein JWM68_2659 [Verrucomicrobiales bacterium]|nr:hypothetical protein [Verrucomicrobiales bacterium]
MPLEDLDSIDIILTPDEKGKIALIITDSGVTTDEEERYRLFMTKSKRYLREVYSSEWLSQYPGKKPTDFFIKVVCFTPPTEEMNRVKVVRSMQNSKQQLPVTFEVWKPAGAEQEGTAAGEKENVVSDETVESALEWVKNNLPDTFDPKLASFVLAAFALCMKAAKKANFLTALPWMEDQQQGEPVVFFVDETFKEEPDEALIQKARRTAGTMPSKFNYWTIFYVASRVIANEERQLMLVVEGWKRGEPQGFRVEGAFKRGLFRRFRLLGDPDFLETGPEDVFAHVSVAETVPIGDDDAGTLELKQIERTIISFAEKILPEDLIPTCYTVDQTGQQTICAFPFESYEKPIETMQEFLRREIADNKLRAYGIVAEATYHSQSRSKSFDALYCLLEHQSEVGMKVYQLFSKDGAKVVFGERIEKPLPERLFPQRA